MVTEFPGQLLQDGRKVNAMDENSDKLATTQIATAALEHLTGPARGTVLADWSRGGRFPGRR